MTRKDFSIIIASDQEHEKIFAETQFDNKFVAVVSQERGTENLEVELPGLNLSEACVLRTVCLAKRRGKTLNRIVSQKVLGCSGISVERKKQRLHHSI